MDKATVEQEISQLSGVVFLEFRADWCGPCHVMDPALHEMEREYAGKLTLKQIDVDQERALAQEFGVMSIPALFVYKDGANVGQLLGLQTKQNLLRFLA
jgi:thioredoxin 1